MDYLHNHRDGYVPSTLEDALFEIKRLKHALLVANEKRSEAFLSAYFKHRELQSYIKNLKELNSKLRKAKIEELYGPMEEEIKE